MEISHFKYQIMSRKRKIKKILIANRGEIAIRIINTAKKMRIKTYVIKTPKEPNALYLQHADVVCEFPENTDEIPEFLDIESIIKVAKKNKIKAIHPGYGFLSENPYFSRRCEEENLTFIGPSSDAIYKMGNKTIAKQIAAKQNVPLIQGSEGNVKNVAHAVQIAEKIGYPIIIKAASGGGGKGMRIVKVADDMDRMFSIATSEAKKAFDDGSVFIEKYVKNPRHIEFQIIGDKYGNIVHLGERECSIQRKHQKLIEESPSVIIDEELRKTIGDAAVRIAKAVKYFSAGTVEFLLDENKNFYFMEMNTRIQVEHPVTEMVTGLDLIELQINIAQGKKLPFKQEDITLKGWAIEFRINAEDVQANFAPYLGTIKKIIFPQGDNIRIDTGIKDGSAIVPYYDSMIAKLIVYGDTRKQAIKNSQDALEKIYFKGIKTTIPFFKAVVRNKAFIKGDLSTSFIEEKMKKLYHQEPDEILMSAFFAAADYINEIKTDKEQFVDYDKGKMLTPWVLNKRSKSI